MSLLVYFGLFENQYIIIYLKPITLEEYEITSIQRDGNVCLLRSSNFIFLISIHCIFNKNIFI